MFELASTVIIFNIRMRIIEYLSIEFEFDTQIW